MILSFWRQPSDICLTLHFLARFERRHLNARRAVIDRLGARCVLLGDRLVMDGHAEGKGARTDKQQKARPLQDYWIIRCTLLLTHCTLTYLPSGTGCLAASSMPYRRQIEGNSV